MIVLWKTNFRVHGGNIINSQVKTYTKYFSLIFQLIKKTSLAGKHWVNYRSCMITKSLCRIQNIQPSRLRVTSGGRWRRWLLCRRLTFVKTSTHGQNRNRRKKKENSRSDKMWKWFAAPWELQVDVCTSVWVTFWLPSSPQKCLLLRSTLGCPEPSLHSVPFRSASVLRASGCASSSFGRFILKPLKSHSEVRTLFQRNRFFSD